MSNWGRIEERMEAAIAKIEEKIPGYSYSKSDAGRTDERVCAFLSSTLEKTKEMLSRIMELSYREEEAEITDALESMKKDVDIFLNELESLRVAEFTDSAAKLESVVKIDEALINGMDEIFQFLEGMHAEIVNRGKDDVTRILEEKRKEIDDLKGLFKERFDLLGAQYGN